MFGCLLKNSVVTNRVAKIGGKYIHLEGICIVSGTGRMAKVNWKEEKKLYSPDSSVNILSATHLSE